MDVCVQEENFAEAISNAHKLFSSPPLRKWPSLMPDKEAAVFDHLVAVLII